MVGNQHPGIASGFCFLDNIGKAGKKVITVRIILKYFALLYTSGYDVVQCPRGVYSRSSWHILINIIKIKKCKLEI